MNNPVWVLEEEKKEFPQLTKHLKTDVVVVGGGLAGVLSAYLLAKDGKKVILVEKDSIGSGETSYTTAFITYVVDISLSKMVETFGEEKAKFVWDSGRTAIAEIERIILEEEIVCDFLKCNAYVFAPRQKDIEPLKKEAEIGRKFGFEASFKNDGKLGFENFGYLEIAKQAKFHPIKFLYQLAKKAKKAGVLIFENTEVLDIEKGTNVRVGTEKGIVEAKFAIVDTYNPINSEVLKPGKLTSFKSYVISFLIKKGVFKEAIYWDTEKPYNYFRLDTSKNLDRVILGGSDHLMGKYQNPEKHFEELEEYFKKVFRNVEYKVENSWTGEILEPLDGIAYIGKSPLNSSILLSTGFSGNGMTYSALSAMINRDIITGKANKYSQLFDPARR